MQIYIENNGNFSHGYQVRVDHGDGREDVVGFRPYTMEHALLMAKKSLDIINRRTGGQLLLKDVLTIDEGALMENSGHDPVSTRLSEKYASKGTQDVGSQEGTRTEGVQICGRTDDPL